MLTVTFAECHIYKPLMLSVVMLNVVMLSVMAPIFTVNLRGQIRIKVTRFLNEYNYFSYYKNVLA
jgi:hypothetical protein